MVEPIEFADVVRLIAADQQKHWMCGRRHLLEDYLPQHPGLREAHESLLDIIYNEVRLRNLTGDVATVQEYLHRFPHLSDEIEPLFQVHSALESAYPESTYSAAAFASQPEIPRSINWPQSTRPIAIIDAAFEAHVVQRRPRDNGQQRVGIVFYYRDEAPLRRSSDSLRLMRKIPTRRPGGRLSGARRSKQPGHRRQSLIERPLSLYACLGRAEASDRSFERHSPPSPGDCLRNRRSGGPALRLHGIR